MIKSLISFVFVLGFQIAQATSMHPCTPVVSAQPTEMYCRSQAQDGKVNYYAIKIQTLMSPASCTGNDRYEVKTAQISVSQGDGIAVAQLVLQNGSFQYTPSSGAANGALSSSVLSLDLKECVSPINGGFSIGN